MPTPRTAGSSRRVAAGAWSGFDKRERNEVEKLLHQGLQRGQRGVPFELSGNLLAHNVGPLQRRLATITKSGNRHRRVLGCGRCTRTRERRQ